MIKYIVCNLKRLRTFLGSSMRSTVICKLLITYATLTFLFQIKNTKTQRQKKTSNNLKTFTHYHKRHKYNKIYTITNR